MKLVSTILSVLFPIRAARPVGIVALLAISPFLLSAADYAKDDEADASKDLRVKFSVEHDGTNLDFVVENSELSEVTATFDVSVDNLKGSVSLPHTATFRPGRTLAFSLSPIRPGQSWTYTYTNYYKLGSGVAVPDDQAYRLPYSAGSSFRVTQGHNGKFSHFGPEQYAIDWDLPEGTPVCAARGGLVVECKDDSDIGGPSMAYDRFNNYILIRHEDGTLGQYCHLHKGSARVMPGQKVKAGECIALSGATGFASGPHLHFCVIKALDGRHGLSVPVKFITAKGKVIIPIEGRSYRAPMPDTALILAVLPN